LVFIDRKHQGLQGGSADEFESNPLIVRIHLDDLVKTCCRNTARVETFGNTLRVRGWEVSLGSVNIWQAAEDNSQTLVNAQIEGRGQYHCHSPFIGKWLVVNRSLEIGKLDRRYIHSPRAIHSTTSIDKHAVHAAISISAAIGDKARFDVYSHDVDTGILLHLLVFSSC
jgi:hypothetical protein